MIIIDQWYKSHIDKISGTMTAENTDDGKFDIIIDNKKMATVEDKETADALISRIDHFVVNYKRSVDTFDISRELELIKETGCKNSNFGSYFS